MKVYLALLAIFFVSASVSSQCAENKTSIDDKFYHVETNFKGNWWKANAFCNSIGLRLVSIMSQKEHDKVVGLITYFGYANEEFWTSGTRLGNKNNYYWMSNGKKFNYTNWYRGDDWIEPDNLNGGQYCVQLWASHRLQWDDTECEAEKYMICEG